MALQSSVALTAAVAVEGDVATTQPAIFLDYPQVPVAEGALVKVGNGVFAGTDPASQVKGAGSSFVGIAARVQLYPINDIAAGASLMVAEHQPVTVLVKGAIYVRPSTAATVGQKIFVSTTDGSVKTGAAGGSVSGHVETPFVVKSACSANDLCVAASY